MTRVGFTLKYLGLILDLRWIFLDYFRLLLPKALEMAIILDRLTANIGGPRENKYRVRGYVCRSIWRSDLGADHGE